MRIDAMSIEGVALLMIDRRPSLAYYGYQRMENSLPSLEGLLWISYGRLLQWHSQRLHYWRC